MNRYSNRDGNILASTLVSVSIAFGGFFLGIGNAVSGFLGTVDHSQHNVASPHNPRQVEDPRGADHHHHHHHASDEPFARQTQPAVTAGFMEALPAHCLFCLDGIAPPPLSVLVAELLSITVVAPTWIDSGQIWTPLRLRVSLFEARAPPALS